MQRDDVTPAAARLCPGCDVEGRRWAAKGPYVIHRCGACGALFVSRTSAYPSNIVATYAGYHANAPFVAPSVVEASLGRLVASATPYRQTGRWLDLGFGEGALLSIAERYGWACFGTEVSPHALNFGVSHGWTVTEDPMQDHRFEQASFDVVTMIEVLEHLANARTFVRDALRWLRPGGLFYLTTPNARSLNRWLLGAEWSIVCPPEHLTIWTASGVRRLLVSNGLRNVRLRAEGFNPAELMAHVRCGANAPQVDRQSTGVALSQALSRTKLRRTFKCAANLVLDLLGVGDTLKARAEKVPGAYPERSRTPILGFARRTD